MKADSLLNLIEKLGTVSIAMKKDMKKPRTKANTMMIEIPSNAVVGEWAAHKIYNNKGLPVGRTYVVTHILSGLRVPYLEYGKVGDAKKTLIALNGAGVSWDGQGKAPSNFMDTIRDIVYKMRYEPENVGAV